MDKKDTNLNTQENIAETQEKEHSFKKKFFSVAPFIAVGLGCIAIAGALSLGDSLKELNGKIEEFDSYSVKELLATGETATHETATPETAKEDAVMYISIDESGDFALSNDSYIPLKAGPDTYVSVPASLFTEDNGLLSVEYDSTQNSIKAGAYSIMAMQTDSKAEDAMTSFTGNDKTIDVAIKALQDDLSIVVAHDTENSSENATEKVQEILNSAIVSNGDLNVYLFDHRLNDTWSEDFSFDNNVAEFSNGNESVYVSRFTGSLTGAGFDDKIPLTEDLSAKGGDIRDDDTGLSPYFVDYGGYAYKVLAASPETIQSMF